MESQAQAPSLALMPQLAEALDEGDDWTGITDGKSRRKRQNRLNQRAYRRRKALRLQRGRSIPEDATHTIIDVLQHQLQPRKTPPTSNAYLLPANNRMVIAPPPDLIFPLTPDHLLPIIQYNVVRAVLANWSLLTLLDSIPRECNSAGWQVTTLPGAKALPPSLVPTSLQQNVRHGLWIDLIPFPTLRDNLIQMTGEYDEDELCDDLVGHIFEDEESDVRGAYEDRCGFISWADPWDVTGWEVTEDFIAKWKFLFRGCQEIVEQTNRWRAVRDEEPLVVEV